MRRAAWLAAVLLLAACGSGGGGGFTPAPGPSPTATPAPPVNGEIDWPTFGFSASRSNENPNESTLTPASVSGLHLLWSRKIGDANSRYADTEPVVAANVLAQGTYQDVVYAGDEHGFFVAANAVNGNVIWSKHLASQATGCGQIPDQVFGITDTPVIDRAQNRIYLADGGGTLWAFDLGSGALASGWPANGVRVVNDPSLDHVWSGLTYDAASHLLFVPTASYCDIGGWLGSLRAVNTQSAAVTATFYFGTGSAAQPNANTTEYGGGIWSWGGVALDPDAPDLFGASGNLEPNEAQPYSDAMTEWNESLAPLASNIPPNAEGDGDFGGSTALYDDAGSHCAAAMRKEGTLFVFDRTNLAAGAAVSLSMGVPDTIDTSAHSSAAHLLYVNDIDSGAYPPGLYAFQTGAGCTISAQPVWSAAIGVGVAPPTVAGGVLYDPAGSEIDAFNAATGAALWNSGSAIRGAVQNGASVVNGRLYAVDWADTLYAFGL